MHLVATLKCFIKIFSFPVFFKGSFMCEPCPPGYSGDGRDCRYVLGGACAINNGGCHPQADCIGNSTDFYVI